MTRQRHDAGDTKFGEWLRSQKSLASVWFDAENLDYIWFAYRSGHIMLIEEKCFMGKPSLAQRDTHGIVHQALEYACSRIPFKRELKGRTSSIKYHGYHILQFENTGPQDGKIYWDGQEISELGLIDWLRFYNP